MLSSKPHPLPLPFPGEGNCLLMGSACPGSVRYWAAAIAAGTVYIDRDERHLPLRHSHHRYAIEGPNGVQQLTVPLVGETHNMATPMCNVRISEHGNWRRLHWGALYSAYGRTPYFEHIAPELESIIVNGHQTHLLDVNTQLQLLIVDFMDLPVTLVADDTSSATDGAGVVDLRGKIDMKRPDQLPIADLPYYQVWSTRHGFVPRLSVLDLMMNEGREGILTLTRMTQEWPISITQTQSVQ